MDSADSGEVKIEVKQKKSKGKAQMSFKFQDGKFPPVIKMIETETAGFQTDFEHRSEGLIALSRFAGEVLEAYTLEKFNALPAPDPVDVMARMMNLCIAKKLAVASDPNSLTKHGYQFSMLRKKILQVPDFYQQVCDGVGFFRYEGSSYTPRDCALHQGNHFLRAVGDLGVDGFPAALADNQFVVNQWTVDWPEIVRAHAYTAYLEWQASDPGANVNINGNAHIIAPPIPSVPVVDTFFADITAMGFAPPLNIGNKLAVVALVDTGLVVPRNPTAAQVAIFEAGGYFIVNWSREICERSHARYETAYFLPFARAFPIIYKMIELKSFQEFGAPWQLVSAVAGAAFPNVGTVPFHVPLSDQITGYMLLSGPRNFEFHTRQLHISSGEMTPDNVRKLLVEKATRS